MNGKGYFGPGHLFGGKEMVRTLSCQFLWRMERANVTGYLIGTDQKIPNWLIKITFLRKVETTIRLGIKSRFSITGTNGAILVFSP